ncbi:MAG TPA: hypothetical protein VMS30_00955 [Phycisphaerales bacterium]|nr:hypothetical protein [Phycisphaerales bacterium]
MPLDNVKERLLMQYLDGTLAGEELLAFKRQLQRDEQLQAHLRAIRHIDTSIRRSFHGGTGLTAASILAMAGNAAPDSVAAAMPRSAPALVPAPAIKPLTVASRGTSMRLYRRLAIAAALLLAAFGAWALWQKFQPGPQPETIARQPTATIRTAADYYNAELSSGFEPEWVCKDDAEFAATFRDRLGQALKLNPSSDASTHMLGLDYTKVLSPLTVSMLAESGGAKIVVLIDRRERDNADAIRTGCGSLQVFRREIGPLVLYELSPLEQAHIIDLFEPAQ